MKSVKCPYCKETILSVLILRFNTSNKPEAAEKDIKFCPFCGFHITLDNIPVQEQDS